jgi:hypothetical protein
MSRTVPPHRQDWLCECVCRSGLKLGGEKKSAGVAAGLNLASEKKKQKNATPARPDKF